MDVNLTKNADKTICLIYKQYLDNKNKIFNTHNISTDFPKSNSDDFREALDELKSQGLLNRDIIGNFSLSTDGIVYMENRFKNGLIEVTDFITKFIP